MTARDFATEMRQVIDEATSHGPYTSPAIAQEIVDKLHANDADLLDGWLHAQAVHFVRDAINYRDRSNRSHVRQTAGRSVFRRDAEAFEGGEGDALDGWLDTVYAVDQDGLRKRLAEMAKPELIFVADDYRRQAEETLLAEAFMRALAKKVRNGKVSDHFDDEKLARLWDSMRNSGQR